MRRVVTYAEAEFYTHLLIANDYLSKSRYNWNSCKSTHKQKVAHKQLLTDSIFENLLFLSLSLSRKV